MLPSGGAYVPKPPVLPGAPPSPVVLRRGPCPQLHEMRETVSILEVKISKLEQLVRLKDSKIATLQIKLQQQQG